MKAAATKQRGGMAVDEALQVLNFTRADLAQTDSTEKIAERFEKMFNANNPADGGSFYLQSKIFRAKEAIDSELSEVTGKPPTE